MSLIVPRKGQTTIPLRSEKNNRSNKTNLCRVSPWFLINGSFLILYPDTLTLAGAGARLAQAKAKLARSLVGAGANLAQGAVQAKIGLAKAALDAGKDLARVKLGVAAGVAGAGAELASNAAAIKLGLVKGVAGAGAGLAKAKLQVAQRWLRREQSSLQMLSLSRLVLPRVP